jgi:GntR family transcriptional regulator
MTPAAAARLGAGPGDPAIRTTYAFLGDGKPVMLSVSWEPAALTSGTAIMLPEEGPHAGETVAARLALAAEAERLGIRPGGIVLTITRIYYTDQHPVETADIVLPAERYAVTYEVPVR